MKVQARHFPVIMMLMPCVLRRRPYQSARRRCGALAQILAARAGGRALALAPAPAFRRRLAVGEGRA